MHEHHATMVMQEHHRRVRAATEHAHVRAYALAGSARRRPWWQRRHDGASARRGPTVPTREPGGRLVIRILERAIRRVRGDRVGQRLDRASRLFDG